MKARAHGSMLACANAHACIKRAWLCAFVLPAGSELVWKKVHIYIYIYDVWTSPAKWKHGFPFASASFRWNKTMHCKRQTVNAYRMGQRCLTAGANLIAKNGVNDDVSKEFTYWLLLPRYVKKLKISIVGEELSPLNRRHPKFFICESSTSAPDQSACHVLKWYFRDKQEMKQHDEFVIVKTSSSKQLFKTNRHPRTTKNLLLLQTMCEV